MIVHIKCTGCIKICSIFSAFFTVRKIKNNKSFIEYILRNNQINVSFGKVIPEIRYWFNEDMRSVNYLFPGLVAIIMSVVAGFLTSLTISREWETGTMEQLIPTPVTEGEVITGKLLTYFLIGLIDVIINCITK